jgi:hypothetical protein
MKEFWKTLSATVVGALIATFTAYLSANWSAEDQRKQFLFQHAQAFSEFFALSQLPYSNRVPEECRAQLDECRRARQAALQIYLFLPTNVRMDLAKAGGWKPNSDSDTDLNASQKLYLKSLIELREWLTGEKEKSFPFILPCADWSVEEKLCRKS